MYMYVYIENGKTLHFHPDKPVSRSLTFQALKKRASRDESVVDKLPGY